MLASEETKIAIVEAVSSISPANSYNHFCNCGYVKTSKMDIKAQCSLNENRILFTSNIVQQGLYLIVLKYTRRRACQINLRYLIG